MTMDKLFDGSDAHLLPGNAELIANLRKIGEVVVFYAPRAAGALEAADKRIAELEAINGLQAQSIGILAKELDEAERKLDVAREALKETTEVLEILRRGHGVDVGSKCYPAINIAREALAQIGGYDAR